MIKEETFAKILKWDPCVIFLRRHILKTCFITIKKNDNDHYSIDRCVLCTPDSVGFANNWNDVFSFEKLEHIKQFHLTYWNTSCENEGMLLMAKRDYNYARRRFPLLLSVMSAQKTEVYYAQMGRIRERRLRRGNLYTPEEYDCINIDQDTRLLEILQKLKATCKSAWKSVIMYV